jgi:hypothetical protein
MQTLLVLELENILEVLLAFISNSILEYMTLSVHPF